MLIFDRFPDEKKARDFMAAITREFKLKTYLCRQEEGFLFDVNYKKSLADNRKEKKAQWIKKDVRRAEQVNVNDIHPDGTLDSFPYLLDAPIVCIERPPSPLDDAKTLEEVRTLAAKMFADPNPSIKDTITERVEDYSGVFAGT